MNANKRISSRKPTLRDAQKAQTRQRLLDAARTVFYREGYYGGTIDQIVAEAGASRPTFYLHFRDKEQLLGELMKQYLAHAVPYMERLPGPRPTVDELKAWLFEVGTFFQQERMLFSVLMEVSSERQSNRPHYGLATLDAWINALSKRAVAFAAAGGKSPDINARARAEILIIEIVWAGGSVARNRNAPFTAETVSVVAKSLHEFLLDPRFQKESAPKSKDVKARKGSRSKRATARST